MIDKIGTIKNPLTIIAMFAALAEISGTAVLPFISEGNQATYLWFLMVFPLALIAAFFLTLNFNHKVLYAPSDYVNEDNFLKSFQSASGPERADKLREEVRQIRDEPPELPPPDPEFLRRAQTSAAEDLHARYLLVEEMVLNKLSKEFKRPIQRDVRFSTGSSSFVFDGAVITDKSVTAIEVKYFRNPKTLQKRIREMTLDIVRAAELLPENTRLRFSLILAVVMDVPASDHLALADDLRTAIGVTPFPVDLRLFGFSELKREFDPGP